MDLKYIIIHIIAFISVTDCARFIGCYRDISQTARLMNDGFKEFPDTLTKDICFDYCKSQSASFAGLQYGRECYCSKTWPSYMYLKNNTECSMKCEGDPYEICGERYLLSVYSLDGRGVNKHESKYVGCFEDDVDDRLLPNRMWEFAKMLTPDFCMGHCWRNGYKYAGVQYGTECYCGDSYNDNLRADEEECSTPCSGDKRLKCGSGLRANVYSTGITEISEENKLIGCFEDEEEVRLLSGLEVNLIDNNSPNRCLNLCNSLGFKFSGVQFKIECFCGNRKPPSSLMVEENECSIPCPGDDTAHCGGNFRLLAYKIGDVDTILPPKKPPTSTPPPRPTPSTNPVLPACKKSVTTVNGKSICKGAVVFLEEFNRPLDRTRWFHSVLMPWSPDFDFVVFTNQKENSYVKSGKLFIKPNLMEEGFVRRGKLSLKDCTGDLFTEECERKAVSYFILPPIESARLNTKESFAFKYGRVDIRAKLLAGDWLYPELYIEPKRKVYGRDYASGKIRIAGARGNQVLRHLGKDIGAGLLEAGIILGTPGEVKTRSVVRHAPKPWSSGFHNFTLIWSPENMWFMVDGQVKQALIPPEGGKLYELLSFKNQSDSWAQSNVPVAPFDQESFISIGLSVGGIRNFPDNSTSGDYKKPWSNGATKAMANFLQSKDQWLSTWTEEGSILEIDSVKVTAL